MSASTRVFAAAASGLPGSEAAADTHTARPPAESVRNPPLAQVLLCKGCCCGQTERGRPPVPVDEFKAIWKAEKLNRSVQLTISGCLGPCRLANVVLVMSGQHAEWFGQMQTDADYSALLGWVRDCHAARRLAPLPEPLRKNTFERFDPGK